MLYVKVHKRLLVALAACAATCLIGGNVYADTQPDAAALKEQLRIMQQRIDELSRQVESLTQKTEQTQAAVRKRQPSRSLNSF